MVTQVSNNRIEQTKLVLIKSVYLYPHESLDMRKLRCLEKELSYKKELLCKPLVYKKSNEKYIILDGHHRIACLKNLGSNHIICEVVKKEQISFSYWNHIVYEEDFLEFLYNNSKIYVSRFEKNDFILEIINRNIRYYIYSVRKRNDREKQLLVDSLINYYLLSGNYNKIPCYEDETNCNETIVIFKKIELDEILEGRKGLCSSGSTRFQIK